MKRSVLSIVLVLSACYLEHDKSLLCWCFHIELQPADKSILLAEEREVGAGIVDHFFGAPTFLTVSGQLHLEIINGYICQLFIFYNFFFMQW